MNDDALFESKLRSLALLHRGKVRDNYAIGDDRLLIVASDRLSAFDVVLPDPIPGKGRVLTAISNFWFERTRHIVANHLTGEPVSTYVEDPSSARRSRAARSSCAGSSPLPVEAVVRGYLIGSGWKDYQANGQVCGIALPPGLKQASKLPAPIFTPATKAAAGQHDENVSFDGGRGVDRPRDRRARARARARTLRFRRRVRARARHPDRRHQVRVRAGRDRRGRADGRGADAGLLALLAGRQLPRRHEPAVLRQAVRTRLPRDPRLGQARARVRGCRPRSSRARPRNIARPSAG